LRQFVPDSSMAHEQDRPTPQYQCHQHPAPEPVSGTKTIPSATTKAPCASRPIRQSGDNPRHKILCQRRYRLCPQGASVKIFLILIIPYYITINQIVIRYCQNFVEKKLIVNQITVNFPKHYILCFSYAHEIHTLSTGNPPLSMNKTQFRRSIISACARFRLLHSCAHQAIIPQIYQH